MTPGSGSTGWASSSVQACQRHRSARPPSRRTPASADDGGPAGWRRSSAPRGKCCRTPWPGPATRSGSWWPAAAAPIRWPSPPWPPTLPAAATWTGSRCPWAPWWWTTSCSPAPRRWPRAPPRPCGTRPRPVEVRTVEVAATGMGPEAAARDARHAALEAAASGAGCRRHPAGPHPRRPGRAGAAGPGPRLGHAVPGRNAARPRDAAPARSWACAARTPWRSAALRNWTPGTIPATPIPPSPARGPAWRCCRCWRKSSAPESPNPWPAPPPSCSSTPTIWKTWPNDTFDRPRASSRRAGHQPSRGRPERTGPGHEVPGDRQGRRRRRRSTAQLPAAAGRGSAAAAAGIGRARWSCPAGSASTGFRWRSCRPRSAAGPRGAGVPREGARCGKLVFRPQQPPRK